VGRRGEQPRHLVERMQTLTLGVFGMWRVRAVLVPILVVSAGLGGAIAATVPLTSGLKIAEFDRTVRPQDDLNAYVNGPWLAATEIPADKSSYGAFDKLYDNAQLQLKGLVEDSLVSAANASANSRKVAAFYQSFMDEKSLEAKGLAPLAQALAQIDSIKTKQQLLQGFAHLQAIEVTVPFGSYVHLDNKDSTRYVYDVAQDGLGLPDRDYYLSDEATLVAMRQQYVVHMTQMLALAGDANAKQEARQILSLETALAKVQWTKVENRDPVKAYNLTPMGDLGVVAPGLEWSAYLKAAGVADKATAINLSQPSYFKALGGLVQTTPLSVWKRYLRWHVLSAYAPYLSKPFVDAHFAFYGTVLQGVPENRIRWKRGVSLVDRMMGEALGEGYVARYFPPESKRRVDLLVKNLLEAYRLDIDTLDWMGPETKREAHAKLASITTKIGYPDHWRDYQTLEVRADDLVGNVMRGAEFEAKRNVAKLGQPVDRSEWGMTPQTVNAYYNAELNEIVFPAAILQAPFFNAEADDAVNYGGIGAVIGHEISHGFDDEGAQYDGTGNLRDWWTKADHESFATKTQALIAQYNVFEPVKGFHLNGELTLGENIADNSGLAIAFKAYQLSLQGKPAPLLDGFSGEQRFYLGFAQVWRDKAREPFMIELIKTDPHSMPSCRVLGTVANQPGFFEAFSIKPGDQMYRAPSDRVLMW